MQCPMCQNDYFEPGSPCPQCGFKGDANSLDEHGLRQTTLTPEEAEKVQIELANLETLFEKVEEWRKAGYFKPDKESLDPVKTQRTRADELRRQLEEYQGPKLLQTDPDRLNTVSFLLDNIDLLASREWFKKKAIAKAVAPIMEIMMDVFSDDEFE
jgi:hypothetical protein